ncbi:PGF-CTERM sorting domain-containing protein [Halobellus ruber]|uniref:PGF-CTERM archaeal protein-sorting signal domain-containing protein n=1 Tax=Halobellus ruber TaxID=2761102 RepID=A0A7J9SK51_9EURY|nr:PGF-CTERM sorting domain-containing protein [Halobellus ruber]MBB6646499.1 hypothetical protein [Halobellus ruber]
MRYAGGEWTAANVTHGIAGATHTATLPRTTPVAVVALDPGETTTVEITFEPRESGSVSLEGEEVGSVDLFADSGGAATSTGTDGSVPGFGALVAALALLVAALAWGRRS